MSFEIIKKINEPEPETVNTLLSKNKDKFDYIYITLNNNSETLNNESIYKIRIKILTEEEKDTPLDDLFDRQIKKNKIKKVDRDSIHNIPISSLSENERNLTVQEIFKKRFPD